MEGEPKEGFITGKEGETRTQFSTLIGLNG